MSEKFFFLKVEEVLLTYRRVLSLLNDTLWAGTARVSQILDGHPIPT